MKHPFRKKWGQNFLVDNNLSKGRYFATLGSVLFLKVRFPENEI